MFCFVLFSLISSISVFLKYVYFSIMQEVGNLQASIKGYFSSFLIMKEVTDFFFKIK